MRDFLFCSALSSLVLAMAALQQALGSLSEERDRKTARKGKGDAKGSGRTATQSNDASLVQGLARLTLTQQPMLRAAFDANSVTFLISPEETKQKLADLVTQWFQQLQEHKDQKGHLPFDARARYFVSSFCARLSWTPNQRRRMALTLLGPFLKRLA